MVEEANIENRVANNAIPRVMFDTNTYRHIIDGDSDQANTAETYQIIRQLILDRKIEAFLSETLFTIEALPKKDRLAFMSVYRPKISTNEEANENTVYTTIMISPSDKHKVDFEGTDCLKEYYEQAITLGFHIIRLPRAGGIENTEIALETLYKVADFKKYFDLAAEVSTRIEERGCGMQFVCDLLAPYDNYTQDVFEKFDLLFKDVNRLPLNARKKRIEEVAKALAEMSDGESVAASIGLGCFAFCTNDSAKNAGIQSVMSDSNVAWLKEEYGFNKLTPTELLAFLSDKISQK